MSSFKMDNDFSKHKDLLLKDYWQSISFEGRFVITGSEFLQKTHGIDIILQGKDDDQDVKIDTKHTRGNWNKLFLEELSCSTVGREKPGWILKETGHPDYIIYTMNPPCYKCYSDCFMCEKDIASEMVGYVCNFKVLRDWFIVNKDSYPLKATNQINKTTGRVVAISELREKVKLLNCTLNFN